MATVFSTGFMDDDLWGRFMHPHRKEYPDDWIGYWKHTVRKQIANPNGFCLVGVDQQNTIKACMLVSKMGDASHIIPAGDASEMAQAADENVGFTDRAADPKAVTIFDNHWPDIAHHFVGERANAWMIELLCVHPDVQRGKGYGRDLIQKAIELGKSEKPIVPVAVIASIIGDPVYEKYGFREVGRADVGELKVQGGSLKFYEEHLKG